MVAQPPAEIFCPRALKRHKDRAAKNFSQHNFLFIWTISELHSRLRDIRREFKNILHIGGRGESVLREKFPGIIIQDTTDAFSPDIIASPEALPGAPGHFDLILSTLDLHSVNDLPGTLIQIRRMLKPDGLFLAAMMGGETLHELRHALTQAEIELTNGLSPRVFPFADKQQIGGLMQRAGFALPVIDSERVIVTYDNLIKMLHDLRGMGETNAIKNRNTKSPGKALFQKTESLYQDLYAELDGRLSATFEIIFMLGWAPHESQQKPLNPGSAEHSLAHALGTKDIKS